jgi:aminoglycoside 3-N-acetyltransferase I
MPPEVEIRVLHANDVAWMRGMLSMFGLAFDDEATYTSKQPDDAYLVRLLSNPDFIAIAAIGNGLVVGGLAAYVLTKFERARSEVYIYDLAVEEGSRRRGIATALIRAVQKESNARGAWVVFVQADREDAAALALYTKLGVREDVVHFDIHPAEGAT